MKSDHYLPQVRAQYEELPYPPRSPAEEKERLIRTWLDDLAMLNHYCYAGKQTFRERFRVLVAGGGTGDSTIFLAEQLRHTNAEIVHLDLSQAAIDIARQRASIVGLGNITWVHESLLALPRLGLGKFDYINCIGVLHHLDDPDEGLRALLAARKDAGALGVMVYGKYARSGVYQMQALMRLVNQGVPDAAAMIRNTRDVLAAAPPTNWFKCGEDLFQDHKHGGDAGLYDLLLHAQDRAYAVDELYDWFQDQHGLHLELTNRGRGRSAYLPEMVVAPKQPGFLESVRTLPRRQQYAIGELLSGSVIMHTFFATPSVESRVPYGDVDYVPGFFNGPTGSQLSALIRQHQSQPFMVNDAATGIAGLLTPGKYGEFIAQHIDGRRDFGAVFACVRAEPALRASPPTDAELFRDFHALFEFLTAIDRLLLRHHSVESASHVAT